MATIAGVLGVRITAETQSFEQGTRKAEQGLDRLDRKAKSTSASVAAFGQSMTQVGAKMTQFGQRMAIGVTAPIVALGGISLRAGADFERAMNRVAGLSGATEREFKALSDQAKELGATTQYTASQAADAMGFLSMAGYDAVTILRAMPDTLTLAASAQLDLAQSADIVTNVMSGFGIEADELTGAVDVLTKAFTSANTDLTQLGDAFKYAGPVAKGSGLSFEETAAALAMMGNAGIQSTMAGTSLRGALTRLLSPTKQIDGVIRRLGLRTKDSNGNLVSMVEIIEQLESSGATTADMMVLFGQRAGPAMAALVEQGSSALRGLVGELENAGGTAQRIADINMRGLRGAWLEFISAIESVQIKITESGLGAFLEDLLRQAAVVIRRFTSLSSETVFLITKLAGIAAAIPPIIIGIGLLIQAFGVLATIAGLVGGVLAFVFSPMMLGILGLVALIGVFAAAWEQNWGNIRTAAETAWEKISTVIDGLRDGLSITDVTVAVGGLWAISFAQSFLSAVLARAGITRAGAMAGARFLFRLGGVAVAASLLWEFILPESTKQAVVDMWHDLADMIANVNLGPLNPFKDRIAEWIQALDTDSWEVPALSLAVAVAGFTIATSGMRVAAMLGAALATSLAGLFVPLATLGVAVGALTFFGLTDDQRSALAEDLQRIIGNPEINLVIKVAQIAFRLSEGAYQGLDQLARQGGDWFDTNVLGPAERLLGLRPDQQAHLWPDGILRLQPPPAPGNASPDTGVPWDLGGFIEAVRAAEGVDWFGLWAGRDRATLDPAAPFDHPQRNQYLQDLTAGRNLEAFVDRDWWQAAATASIAVYWEQFGHEFPEAAGRAFSQVAPAVQAEFVRWLAPKWAPKDAANDPTNLNENWARNVGRSLGLPGFQEGGLLPGHSGPDQFLAMLAPGEAVVPSSAVNRGWPGVLAWFKSMGVPGFQSGFVPAGAGNVQLGDFSASGLQGMVDGMKSAVEGVGQVMLQGMTVIMDVLLTAVEAVARALLGDEQFEQLASTIADARERMREFIDIMTGRVVTIPVPDVTANVNRGASDGTTSAGGPGIGQRVLGTLQEFGNGLLNMLVGSNSILAKAAEAWATGGPMGALLAVIQQSEAFAVAMEMLEPLIQLAADTFGKLIDPLLPLIEIVSAVLTPVLTVFGTIFESLLLPIMPIVFMGLKMLGMAVLALAIGLGAVWNAIAAAFNFLVGWIPGVQKLNSVDLGDLAKQFSDLSKLTYDDAQALVDHRKATRDNQKAVENVTASLKNVPDGFKVALRTFQSATGARIPALADGGIVTGPTIALIGEAGPEAVVPLDQMNGGGVTIGTVHINGVNDPEEIWARLQHVIQRANQRRSGTPISTGPRFST